MASRLLPPKEYEDTKPMPKRFIIKQFVFLLEKCHLRFDDIKTTIESCFSSYKPNLHSE